jgi:hypothetical protein
MRKFALLAMLFAVSFLPCNSRNNLEQDLGQDAQMLERKPTASEAEMIACSGFVPRRGSFAICAE